MKRLTMFAVMTIAASAVAAAAQTKNGFDLTGALVPADQILAGGPPRDGIPAIDQPKFVAARVAHFLRKEDRVLGIVRNGVVKAYPVRILNWHEIVNDHFGDEPIVVTYCPLCGSGIAFVSAVKGRSLSFGVSGLLYNSDVLLYDRQMQSLWSQILAKAVTGPMKGAQLTAVALTHTSWADWRRRHPHTLVLSTDTGFTRDYSRDPYAGYAESPNTMFPVSAESARYPAKALVIGVKMGVRFKAYPFVELAKMPGGVLKDTLGGQVLTLHFDRETRTGTVFDAQGREVPSVIAYWFAWYAFHHDTEVFQAW